MSNFYKVIAPVGTELPAVQYMPIENNKADVWLRKNVQQETVTDTAHNEDGEEITYNVVCADEMYFQVDSDKVSEQDIKDNFEKYWVYGEKWKNRNHMTDKEKIAELEAENASLKQCIVELSELL